MLKTFPMFGERILANTEQNKLGNFVEPGSTLVRKQIILPNSTSTDEFSHRAENFHKINLNR